MNSNTSTLNRLVLSSETTTDEVVQIDCGPAVVAPARDTKSTVNAVYGYIRAIRALGRTEINTVEIAHALSLPVSEVNHAISLLKEKGVKEVNG